MSTHTWVQFLLLTFNFLYHLGFSPVDLNFQANLDNFPLKKKNWSNPNMPQPGNG